MKTFEKKIVLKVLVQKPSEKNRFEALKSKILQKKNNFDYLISKIIRKKNRLKGYDHRPCLKLMPHVPFSLRH